MYLVESNKRVTIDDLGLTVDPVQPVWVTPEQRKSSDCLRLLERLGSVRVSWGEPSRETRVPKKRLPPSIAMSRPNMGGMKKAVEVAPAPPEEPKISLTKAELGQMINAAASKAAREAIKHVPTAQPVNVNSGVSEEALRSIIEEYQQKVVSQRSFESKSTKPETNRDSSGPEEPLFIPQGIVESGKGTAIEVKSESTTSGDLSDAASALKKARRGKSSKKE